MVLLCRVFFCVLLSGIIGCGGGGSKGGGAAAVPTSPPAIPTGVTAIALAHSIIKVTWQASSGATGYVVKFGRVAGQTTQTAGTVGAVTEFGHTNLTELTAYFYVVIAINSAGASLPSQEVNATTPQAPTTEPAAPTNLTAQALSVSSIQLTWTDNSTNEESFVVKYSTNATSVNTDAGVTLPDVQTFTVTGLSAGTQYFFRVRAENFQGTSAYTNVADATTSAAGSGTWVEQTLPPALQSYNLVSIAGFSIDDLFVTGVTSGGSGVIIHKDATSWTEMTLPISSSTVYFPRAFAANDIYALTAAFNGLGFDGYILHWDGLSWSVVFQQNSWMPLYFFSLSATNIYVVGTGGIIVHWNGSSWTLQTSGTTTDLSSVWASSATDIFVVGGTLSPSGNPIILHSANGTTWSPQTIPSSVTLRLASILGTSASNIVACGDGGTILRYNGSIWTQETSGTTDAIKGPYALSSNTFVAIATSTFPLQGSLLQSSNGGAWTSPTPIMTGKFLAWATIVSGTNAFAFGGGASPSDTGIIYHYDGANWTLEAQPRSLVQWVHAVSSSEIWAVGANGLVLRRQ